MFQCGKPNMQATMAGEKVPMYLLMNNNAISTSRMGKPVVPLSLSRAPPFQLEQNDKGMLKLTPSGCN